MIKFLRSLLMIALMVLVFACSKDDPLPRAEVGFTNEIAEVGIPVMFDNETLNGDRYEWTFSDGQSSTEISPIMTFNDAGPIQVVLKAFTKDNQVDSVARPVTINQRYLTAYWVKAFPADSLGFAWDKNEVIEEDKLPDILVDLIVAKTNPTEAELENSLLDGIFLNAKQQDVSNEITLDLILTDEDWNFSLSDWDGADVNNITLSDPFSLVMVATFNPVLEPTTKTADGSMGSFSLTGFNSNGYFIDIVFFFDLRYNP